MADNELEFYENGTSFSNGVVFENADAPTSLGANRGVLYKDNSAPSVLTWRSEANSQSTKLVTTEFSQSLSEKILVNPKLSDANGPVYYGTLNANPNETSITTGSMYYNSSIQEMVAYTSDQKWLSLTSYVESQGRRGVTAPSSFLRRNNANLSNSTGLAIPFEATILKVTVNRNNTAPSTIVVRNNGGGAFSLDLQSNTFVVSNNISVDVSQGIICIFNDGPNNVTNCNVTIYYKQRIP
jgi:hypothetical protein